MVEVTTTGSETRSTVIGYYEKKMYKVDYLIRTNRNWETVGVEIESRHSNQTQSIRLEADGKGNWLSNGKRADLFAGCIDVDISLTPFTNTLPINRLRLRQGQTQEIRVVYCNLLEHQLQAVRQKYTRLSDTEYRYENVPNDFEATILADESGFVVDYPGLFVRTVALKTNYY